MSDPRAKYTKEQIAAAAALWREGLTMHQIAEKVGLKWSNIRNMADTRRRLFPYRKNNSRRANSVVTPASDIAPVTPAAKPGCVVRTTITGAKVTMPRVVFIDGPEPDAEAA